MTIQCNEVPKDAKVLILTLIMKKKASVTYRVKLNARGYEQVAGEHYDKNTKAAPVINEATIRLVFMLMVMIIWYA